MPTVQYSRGATRITKEIPTPKRISELDAWYRAAQKAIQDVPIIHQANQEGWHLTHSTATLSHILFELENRAGERAKLLILRQTVTF